MLQWSLTFSGPLSIRYPRGTAEEIDACPEDIVEGQAETPRFFLPGEETNASGETCTDVAFLSAGTMYQTALSAAEALKDAGISSRVVNLRFLKPICREAVLSAAEHSSLVVTLEDGLLRGGIGEQAIALIAEDADTKRRPRTLSWASSESAPSFTVMQMMSNFPPLLLSLSKSG